MAAVCLAFVAAFAIFGLTVFAIVRVCRPSSHILMQRGPVHEDAETIDEDDDEERVMGFHNPSAS